MKAKKTRRAAIIVGSTIFLLVELVPSSWHISLSFDREALSNLSAFSLILKAPTAFDYSMAFQSIPLARYYLSTIFLTTVSTVTDVSFVLMCRYTFARGDLAFKKFWLLFAMATMMIPFESRMVLLFLQCRKWGLVNTYIPLVVGNFAYAYGIFFTKQNIEGALDSLRESAYIDRAGEWRISRQTTALLSKPLIAALSILQILGSWNSCL